MITFLSLYAAFPRLKSVIDALSFVFSTVAPVSGGGGVKWRSLKPNGRPRVALLRELYLVQRTAWDALQQRLDPLAVGILICWLVPLNMQRAIGDRNSGRPLACRRPTGCAAVALSRAIPKELEDA